MANIIGLTGQTGAGKSTVRDIFEEKGAAVIDADTVAHGITDSNLDCIYDIVSHFSCLVLNEKGKINRKALGRIVFSDKKELAVLNRIIFPYILDEVEHRVLEHIAKGAGTVVIDGATIIESGCGRMCDAIVSVIAEKETRITRIIKRDGITKAEAERRVDAQKPEEFYISNADYVISNDTTPAELERRVNSVLKNMLNKREEISAEE